MFANAVCLVRKASQSLYSRATYATEATLKCEPAKLHRFEKGPSTEDVFKKDEAQALIQQMYTVRAMEDELASLYKQKKSRGFCHLYQGQEAICCGVKSRLGPKDTVITSYRCHPWTVVMGAPIVGVLAELQGKVTGISKGKGGSMHIYADHFYGGNGIVGAQVPLGTGLGLKNKYNNDGGFSVTAYGDGAANQGQVAEAFNIAKLWSLPVLYLIENNLYGMGTSAQRASANTDYYQRGDLIPGIQVDGMDIVAVRTAMDFAKEHFKAGKGPILIETRTYRYLGHSMSDAANYRTREEIKEVRDNRDPINKFKKKLLEAGLLTEDEIKKAKDEGKKIVKAASAQSQKDKDIELTELGYDVYAHNLEGRIRRTAVYDTMEHKVLGKVINLK
ncbi:Dehydrogenase E1 component [Popillia japonica]|uniref:pyruvate dehydrogenase (acetyl-transferring) n=1 Tax=Popillia japonica TaxID=7064 RepID=A0AAW1JW50_POPJA